jgi:hypothetical protein
MADAVSAEAEDLALAGPGQGLALPVGQHGALTLLVDDGAEGLEPLTEAIRGGE